MAHIKSLSRRPGNDRSSLVSAASSGGVFVCEEGPGGEHRAVIVIRGGMLRRFLDLLLLWRQRFAGGRDAATFLLKLVNPTAQGRLDQTERAGCFGMTVALIEHQAGGFAFELRGGYDVAWSSDASLWRAFSPKRVSGFIRPLRIGSGAATASEEREG